jgi:hypothetical protein
VRGEGDGPAESLAIQTLDQISKCVKDDRRQGFLLH